MAVNRNWNVCGCGYAVSSSVLQIALSQLIPLTCQSRPNRPGRAECGLTESQSPENDGERRIAKSFIPLYPNNVPTVPKPSGGSRTASLVLNNLEASQRAITRLLNRW